VPLSRLYYETQSQKRREEERKDLNQDNINKPVAGREKPKQLITPGRTLQNLYKNSISEKLFERPQRGRNHEKLLLASLWIKCVRITLL
jgi:hypothetical protein